MRSWDTTRIRAATINGWGEVRTLVLLAWLKRHFHMTLNQANLKGQHTWRTTNTSLFVTGTCTHWLYHNYCLGFKRPSRWYRPGKNRATSPALSAYRSTHDSISTTCTCNFSTHIVWSICLSYWTFPTKQSSKQANKANHSAVLDFVASIMAAESLSDARASLTCYIAYEVAMSR